MFLLMDLLLEKDECKVLQNLKDFNIRLHITPIMFLCIGVNRINYLAPFFKIFSQYLLDGSY